MKRLAAILGLAAVIILGGCGGGDDGGGGGFVPPKTVVDVKAGTWRLSGSINLTACGIPTIIPPSREVEACDGLDIDGFLGPLDLDCDVTVSGNTIRVTCTGVFPVGECEYDISVQGTGNVTGSKDALAVNGTLTLSLKTGDPGECEYGSGCTGSFTMSGSWLQAEPCAEGTTMALTEDQLGRFLMGPILGGTATP